MRTAQTVACAYALAIGASAYAQESKWRVKHDHLEGIWAERSRSYGHEFEVLAERTADGERRLSMCIAVAPHGYELEVTERAILESGEGYEGERYVRARPRRYGRDATVYVERAGKPLYGAGFGRDGRFPIHTKRRGTPIRCLDRFDLRARPDQTEPEEPWGIDTAHPRVGYWAGTVEGDMPFRQRPMEVAIAIAQIDAHGRATGLLCTTRWMDPEGHKRMWRVRGFPLGPTDPRAPGGATLSERILYTWSSPLGRPSDSRYPTPLKITTALLTSHGATAETTWWVSEIDNGRVNVNEVYMSDDLAPRTSASGEARRTVGPDGCLKTLAPLLPPMRTRERAEAEADADPERVRVQSHGRWRERAG